MNFCEHCGARLGTGRYCGNCGRLAVEDAGVTDAGAAATPTPTDAPTKTEKTEKAEQTDEVATAGQTNATHLKNPFADIGLADYGRDIVALVLLIATFGMPWDASDTSADKIHVVLVTMLAMASLTLPYLKRGRVLPSTWDDSEVRVARALANVPYVVVVVITIAVDLATDDPTSGGVGVGVAFGLAGVVLAAQARSGELASPVGQAQVWRLVTVVLGVVAAVLTMVRLIYLLANISPGTEWTSVVLDTMVPLIYLMVLVVPVIGVWRGNIDSRNLLIAVGVAGVVLSSWRLSDQDVLPDVLSIPVDGPAELLWLSAAAAVTAPGVPQLFRPIWAVGQWLDTARSAFGLTAVLAGAAAAYWAVFMVGIESGRVTTITLLVLALLAVTAALVGRNTLRADPTTGWPVALVGASVLAVIAVISQAVHAASDPIGGATVNALVVVSVLAFAATILLALTIPREIRDEFGKVSFSHEK